jgi:hypothetical protein
MTLGPKFNERRPCQRNFPEQASGAALTRFFPVFAAPLAAAGCILISIIQHLENSSQYPPASAVSACKSLSPPFRWTNTPGGIPACRRTRFYEYS